MVMHNSENRLPKTGALNIMEKLNVPEVTDPLLAEVKKIFADTSICVEEVKAEGHEFVVILSGKAYQPMFELPFVGLDFAKLKFKVSLGDLQCEDHQKFIDRFELYMQNVQKFHPSTVGLSLKVLYSEAVMDLTEEVFCDYDVQEMLTVGKGYTDVQAESYDLDCIGQLADFLQEANLSFAYLEEEIDTQFDAWVKEGTVEDLLLLDATYIMPDESIYRKLIKPFVPTAYMGEEHPAYQKYAVVVPKTQTRTVRFTNTAGSFNKLIVKDSADYLLATPYVRARFEEVQKAQRQKKMAVAAAEHLLQKSK